jgi:hypothetical protein
MPLAILNRAHFNPVAPAFPDATTTGVPPGTSLAPLVGDQTITTAGTVIEDKLITGSVIVNASATGTIIRRCRIQSSGFYVIYNYATTGTPLLVEDCELDGLETNNTAIADSNFTARRCNIHSAENGASLLSDVTIEDCYIHDLFNGGEAHADGIQIADAGDSITINHNRIYCVDSALALGTSAIIMPSVAAGGASNVAVTNNLFAGGAYTLYGVQNGPGTNLTITGNRFTTQFASLCGAFGPWTDCTDEQTVSDNRWYDGPNSGQLLT